MTQFKQINIEGVVQKIRLVKLNIFGKLKCLPTNFRKIESHTQQVNKDAIFPSLINIKLKYNSIKHRINRNKSQVAYLLLH